MILTLLFLFTLLSTGGLIIYLRTRPTLTQLLSRHGVQIKPVDLSKPTTNLQFLLPTFDSPSFYTIVARVTKAKKALRFWNIRSVRECDFIVTPNLSIKDAIKVFFINRKWEEVKRKNKMYWDSLNKY
jgi:hypothetical protein